MDSDEDIPLAMTLAMSARKNVDEDVPIITHEIKAKTNSGDSTMNTVDTLFEYRWPKNKTGEFYHVLEQLTKFLEVKDNDERLKQLPIRCASDGEIELLKAEGILTVLQNKADIQVVKTEDAFLFMAETGSDKFMSYIRLIRQKEMKKLVITQEAQRANTIKGNIPNIMKRSLKETVRFNEKLNRERKEERQAYFDLQTQIIHLPQKKQKLDPNNKTVKSKYPVALMPGQYQDHFRRYTPEELKLLPLNTVTGKLPRKQPKEKVDEKDAEKDAAVSGSENEEDNASVTEDIEHVTEGKDPFCGICMKGPAMNKRGVPEKLIHCSQCENSGHPSCLDMNRNIVKVIRTYPWQCVECKVCTECLAPHDEESMMFCDNCDRGYHSYCVGLKEIPKGRWVCDKCGKCSSCLGTNPVPDGGPGRWKNEFTKPFDQIEPEFLQIHCHPCSKLFRKGSFCPVCLKVYRACDDHVNPMVCCDTCDRWIHTDCDGIDENRYVELSKDQRAQYTCILCRGETEERMDSYHRKYR